MCQRRVLSAHMKSPEWEKQGKLTAAKEAAVRALEAKLRDLSAAEQHRSKEVMSTLQRTSREWSAAKAAMQVRTVWAWG